MVIFGYVDISLYNLSISVVWLQFVPTQMYMTLFSDKNLWNMAYEDNEEIWKQERMILEIIILPV